MIPRALLFVAVIALAGCPAVYPELGTRTRPIPAGIALDPPPPQELRFLRLVSGKVPPKRRDGQPWQGNGKASPYAKLILNGTELFRTNVQSDTLEPTWKDAPHGNFKIAPTDKLRVELWDSNAINDKPVGVKDLGPIDDLQPYEGQLRVEYESGGEVLLTFEPAHAVNGLGLWFELRTDSCGITRLLEGSPADRAGLKPGDEVLKISGRDVKSMTADEVRSLFNAVPFDGLKIMIKHSGGPVTEVTLKEGPIYPTFSQFGAVD